MILVVHRSTERILLVELKLLVENVIFFKSFHADHELIISTTDLLNVIGMNDENRLDKV